MEVLCDLNGWRTTTGPVYEGRVTFRGNSVLVVSDTDWLNFDKSIQTQGPLFNFFQSFQSWSSSVDAACQVVMEMDQLKSELML